MTFVIPCSICSRAYHASDLYWLTIEVPHYIDLPEDAEHVDPRDEDDEPVIQLHYCERCLDAVETPPLEATSDPSIAPEPADLAPGGGR